MRILKYKISDGGIIKFDNYITPLHVGEQNGEIMLWAAVETESNPTIKEIDIIGTGQSFKSYAENSYIGTVQMKCGMVWHVFINDVI